MTDPCLVPRCDDAPDVGQLCATHGRHLRDALGAREGLGRPGRESHGLPWAWERLRGVLAPGSADRARGASIDPAAPLNLAALDLRNAIRDTLGETWALVRDHLGLRDPEPLVLSTSVVEARHIGRDWAIVRTSAELLLRRDALAALLAHDAAGYVLGDLTALMSRAHALTPWRSDPQHIEHVPCRCMATALHDHGDVVKCWNCGVEYEPEHYQALIKVMATRFADAAP